MRSVHFLSEAEADFVETFAWYEEQRAGLGYEFLDSLIGLLQRVARSPRLFPVAVRRTRRARLRRFSYWILFTIEPEWSPVTGLFHSRRDPLRWSDRVRDRVGTRAAVATLALVAVLALVLPAAARPTYGSSTPFPATPRGSTFPPTSCPSAVERWSVAGRSWATPRPKRSCSGSTTRVGSSGAATTAVRVRTSCSRCGPIPPVAMLPPASRRAAARAWTAGSWHSTTRGACAARSRTAGRGRTG